MWPRHDYGNDRNARRLARSASAGLVCRSVQAVVHDAGHRRQEIFANACDEVRRSRAGDLGLDGRCLRHDYDPGKDTDGSVLELLLTAPMLVTHWINWQYHASTCDPEHLGSGNKLLHDVVGGCIGVFEGNGGELRIGLSKQSLHDGARCMHEPLRLRLGEADLRDVPLANGRSSSD